MSTPPAINVLDLLQNINTIKMDLHALANFGNSVNAQKVGWPNTVLSSPITLITPLTNEDERKELIRLRQLAGGKRKASSKKRKSKKRKSKKRKSKKRKSKKRKSKTRRRR